MVQATSVTGLVGDWGNTKRTGNQKFLNGGFHWIESNPNTKSKGGKYSTSSMDYKTERNW